MSSNNSINSTQQHGGRSTASIKDREKDKEDAEGTAVVIRTLRAQLDAANKACQAAEEECGRLTSAVAAREQEITRSSKLIGGSAAAGGGAVSASKSSNAFNDSSNSGGLVLTSYKAEQFVAADIANKRIIDQLNGQVDFLNNELARREAQLIENNDKMLQFESLRIELVHR